MDSHTPEQLTAALLSLLDVEEIDTDLHRGARQPGGVGRVFGGQVIAQALQAAQRSVDPAKTAHSLHAYFMRPGDEQRPSCSGSSAISRDEASPPAASSRCRVGSPS